MLKKICVLQVFGFFAAQAMEDNRIVAARARWIGNELGFAIFRSIMNAHHQETGTLFDKNQNRALADINDTWHVVKTYFEYDDKPDELVLEHDKFIDFLYDNELLKKARLYKRLQQNLAIKCTIL
jgi:hypothetical protein